MLQAAKLALLEEVKTALEGITDVYAELSQKDAQGTASFMRFAYTTTYFDFLEIDLSRVPFMHKPHV